MKKKLPSYEKSAYEKWLSYWQMKVPWPASPEDWQAWNGAVEVIAEYVNNYNFNSENSCDLSKEILKKFLDK